MSAPVRALAAARLLAGASDPAAGAGRPAARLAVIVAQLIHGGAAEKKAAKLAAEKLLELGASELRRADSGGVGAGFDQAQLFENV